MDQKTKILQFFEAIEDERFDEAKRFTGDVLKELMYLENAQMPSSAVTYIQEIKTLAFDLEQGEYNRAWGKCLPLKAAYVGHLQQTLKQIFRERDEKLSFLETSQDKEGILSNNSSTRKKRLHDPGKNIHYSEKETNHQKAEREQFYDTREETFNANADQKHASDSVGGRRLYHYEETSKLVKSGTKTNYQQNREHYYESREDFNTNAHQELASDSVGGRRRDQYEETSMLGKSKQASGLRIMNQETFNQAARGGNNAGRHQFNTTLQMPIACVGAIDIGMTHTGWAMLLKDEFESNPTKSYVRQWISGTSTLLTEKTPTVVLVKPDGLTLEAFGYDAENRYKDLVEAEEHEDYFYFRRFKMMFDKKLEEKIDKTSLLKDEMGRKLPALDVFAMVIRYLIDDMHRVVSNRIVGGIAEDDVHWVLTVPSIWTDSAKKFMRKAGKRAGIAPENLSIALEPEAASIFCRHLTVSERRDETGVSVSSFPAGAKYIVLDAGV